jgi:hypothetical protein
MDALIFFMAATAISSVALYYSALVPQEMIADHGSGRSNPDQVLGTVLHSSIGVEIAVDGGTLRHISPDTEVGQCLLLESELIIQGVSDGSFAQLNEQIEIILLSVCGPFYGHCLTVWATAEDECVAIFAVSGGTASSENVFASSSRLYVRPELEIVVQLVLAPSLLPEVLQVPRGHLDLLAGIVPSPSELYPGDDHHGDCQGDSVVQILPIVTHQIDYY